MKRFLNLLAILFISISASAAPFWAAKPFYLGLKFVDQKGNSGRWIFSFPSKTPPDQATVTIKPVILRNNHLMRATSTANAAFMTVFDNSVVISYGTFRFLVSHQLRVRVLSNPGNLLFTSVELFKHDRDYVLKSSPIEEADGLYLKSRIGQLNFIKMNLGKSQGTVGMYRYSPNLARLQTIPFVRDFAVQNYEFRFAKDGSGRFDIYARNLDRPQSKIPVFQYDAQNAQLLEASSPPLIHRADPAITKIKATKLAMVSCSKILNQFKSASAPSSLPEESPQLREGR